MVKAFGAEVQASNDPSYIGFSKEGDANKSMKTLFSGIGNLIDQKSDFYAEKQKLDADAVAENIVESNTQSEAVQGAVGQETVLGGSGQDSVSTEIQNVSSRGTKLTQAYKEGKITSSSYWAQMDSMVKAAKARYPGQADRIETQVAQALGRRPAAAAIEEAREEWKSSLAEKNEDEKMFARFVETNAQHLPPDYYARQNEGRPYTKIETRSYVTEGRIDAEKSERARLQLTEAKARGDLTQESSVGRAMDEANGLVNRVLTATADTSKNFRELLETARTKGKDLTPDEQMALRRSFAGLKFTIQEGVEGILSSPWPDSTSTYYNQIKSPEKIKQIKEQAVSRIDYYEKLINDKDYGLLNADINRTKAMRDEASRKVLESSDSIRTYEAVKNIGGGDLLNEVLLSPEGQKLKTDAAKALRSVTLGRIMSGDAKSLDEEMKKSKGVTSDKTEEGKLNYTQISESVGILVNPKAPVQVQLNTARALFGPENRHFLSNVKDSQKLEIFSKLASPEVTKQMVKLKSTDPDSWNNYKAWVKIGFGQTFSKLARDIQEGVTARPNINIQWDAQAKQFSLASTPERRSDMRNPLAGGLRSLENLMTSNVEKSLNEFNKQLRILTPVMEADGQDVSEELLGFMNALGIDDDAPKNLSIFTKIRGAMIKNFEKMNPPKEGGEGEAKKR